MKNKNVLLPVLILLFAQIIFSQKIETNKQGEISPELRKEAVAFLRETAGEVNNLRSSENRISFSAEIANLMWFNDEKEARAMFQTVINDFRQLLLNYDAQINASGITPVESSPLVPDSSASAELFRKFMKAIAVRQEIAMAIAEHDPQLALDFFNGTSQVITNAEYRKQFEQRDANFEMRLLKQVAENDPEIALKYGRKALEKGFNYETVNLLKKIYSKDAEKGAAFGEDILAKLKSDSSKPIDFYVLSSLLETGVKNFDEIKDKSKKTPMFSNQSLREMSEIIGVQILKSENGDVAGLVPLIERFAPARAAQIRQKYKIKNEKNDMKDGGESDVETENASNLDDSSKTMENLQNLDAGKLSKEERDKVIGEARKSIAQIKEPTQKLMALSVLASQIAQAGDKQLASEILDEARGFVNLQPKNYLDFMQIWMLSSGYAQVDADKAFPLIEDAVFRVNDLISAFVKVGEFLDVNGEFIQDGEVQVGGFGGEITRGMMSSIGNTDSTIKNLAVADFARTKALTDKFDRQEVRILAKMLVLRSIFGGKSVKIIETESETSTEDN